MIEVEPVHLGLICIRSGNLTSECLSHLVQAYDIYYATFENTYLRMGQEHIAPSTQ